VREKKERTRSARVGLFSNFGRRRRRRRKKQRTHLDVSLERLDRFLAFDDHSVLSLLCARLKSDEREREREREREYTSLVGALSPVEGAVLWGKKLTREGEKQPKFCSHLHPEQRAAQSERERGFEDSALLSLYFCLFCRRGTTRAHTEERTFLSFFPWCFISFYPKIPLRTYISSLFT